MGLFNINRSIRSVRHSMVIHYNEIYKADEDKRLVEKTGYFGDIVGVYETGLSSEVDVLIEERSPGWEAMLFAKILEDDAAHIGTMFRIEKNNPYVRKVLHDTIDKKVNPYDFVSKCLNKIVDILRTYEENKHIIFLQLQESFSKEKYSEIIALAHQYSWAYRELLGIYESLILLTSASTALEELECAVYMLLAAYENDCSTIYSKMCELVVHSQSFDKFKLCADITFPQFPYVEVRQKVLQKLYNNKNSSFSLPNYYDLKLGEMILKANIAKISTVKIHERTPQLTIKAMYEIVGPTLKKIEDMCQICANDYQKAIATGDFMTLYRTEKKILTLFDCAVECTDDFSRIAVSYQELEKFGFNALAVQTSNTRKIIAEEYQWRVRDAIEQTQKRILHALRVTYRNVPERRNELLEQFRKNLNFCWKTFDEETKRMASNAYKIVTDEVENKQKSDRLPLVTVKAEKKINRSICVADTMTGEEFESWCGWILKQVGFVNVRFTPSTGDQGVDILAQKDSIKYAIQCKCYSSTLNNTPIQEVVAGKTFYGCHVGTVMTNSYFTKGAKSLADATGILLWDRDYIQKLLQSIK